MKLRNLLSVLCFLLLVSGCNRNTPDPPVKEIAVMARELTLGETTRLEELCDWNKMYAAFSEAGVLPPRNNDSDSLYPLFLKGMKLLFQPPDPNREIKFNTIAFCHDPGRCDVFLYDGEADGSGPINLVFEMEYRKDQRTWKITSSNFYAYLRWAITAQGDSRRAYRQKMISQFK